MKIIVTGSRGFTDYSFLKEKMRYYLSELHPVKPVIISGTAKGADQVLWVV